jgi:hypothetical protein
VGQKGGGGCEIDVVSNKMMHAAENVPTPPRRSIMKRALLGSQCFLLGIVQYYLPSVD